MDSPKAVYLIFKNFLLKYNKYTKSTYITAYGLMNFRSDREKGMTSSLGFQSPLPSTRSPPHALLRAEAVLCLVWLLSLTLCLRDFSIFSVVGDHFSLSYNIPHCIYVCVCVCVYIYIPPSIGIWICFFVFVILYYFLKEGSQSCISFKSHKTKICSWVYP